MPEPVRLVDLKSQHAEIRAELEAALLGVLDSGAFILGPEAAAFEAEFARHLGVAHAVGVNSGTDAILLVLDALREQGRGGDVVTTPFSFFATAEAVLQAGFAVRFADVEADSFNLDPAAVADAVGPRTAALLPVHLFGRCADIDALKGRDLPIVEDAAQAVGASYKGRPAGGLGLAGCFSFYVTKNLGAAGDAGAVTTGDAGIAALVRSLRAHGEVHRESDRTYHYERVGRNSRLDGFQAAVLRVKLRRLAAWEEARQRNARFYDRALAGVDGLLPPAPSPQGRHVYHQYVVRASRRDELKEYLAARTIETRVFYPQPLHLMPALRSLGLLPGTFPVAEAACREVLALPVHAHLGDAGRVRVAEAIRAFYGAR